MKNVIYVAVFILSIVLMCVPVHATQSDADKAVAIALPEVKKSEAFSSVRYQDPAKGKMKVTAIGYGETRFKGDTITEEQASQLLAKRLYECDVVVMRYISRPITVQQRAALISFVYNLGETNFAGSTLVKKINAGKLSQAPVEFRKWCYSGKTKMKGLALRREREIAMATWK